MYLFFFKDYESECVDINLELDMMKTIFIPGVWRHLYPQYFYFRNDRLESIYKLLLKHGKGQEQNKGPFQKLEHPYDRLYACYYYFI